jgi:uncharacterized damage-inducible protein DinB
MLAPGQTTALSCFWQVSRNVQAHSEKPVRYQWASVPLLRSTVLDLSGHYGRRMTEPQWTASAPERHNPDRVACERTALEQWVDYHRATLISKCAGLTSEQLKRRASPPSTLSLLGLVRHMTEVERWWFRMHAGREELTFPYDTEGVGRDFDDLEGADAAANIEAFWQEVDAARAAVADKSLDLVVPSRGDHPERTRDLRWIFLHMIEEYARHNGHADFLREAIDGKTGV